MTIDTSNMKIPVIMSTGSFLWNMQVIGTHFPALSYNTSLYPARITLISSEPNKLIVNANDGAGDHVYNFVQSGLDYVLNIEREVISNPTLWTGGANNQDGIMFQDLSVGIDDFYNQTRTLTFKVENFLALTQFSFSRVGLYGTVPSVLNRLVILKTLELFSIRHFTGLDSGLSKVYLETLDLSGLGFSLGIEIPDFILNSSSLKFVGLSNMLDLSSGATNSRLGDMLSNASFLPDLNGFNLRNNQINYQLPNLHRVMNGLLNVENEDTGFKLSDDLSTYSFAEARLENTNIGNPELQRLINGSQIVILNAPSCGISADIVASNNTIESILLGRSDSLGGALPTVLSTLTALKTAIIGSIGDGNKRTTITSWGTAGVNNTVNSLQIDGQSLFPTTIPSWFTNLTNLTKLTLDNWDNQTDTDTHVDNFYTHVDANCSKTNATGYLIGLDYNLRTNVARGFNLRPTGTYQQPTGYSAGTSNGTPASQMEKIWVLVHQYNMIVRVLNTLGNGIDIYTP